MERLIAKELLDRGAVFLRPNDPFTWASGIQSPIYCDNRLTLSYPRTREKISQALTKLVQNNFPAAEYIMGTATAGIPHATMVATALDLPLGYVRSSSKGHGRTNQIEGEIIEGAKVVVIEDLISTGGSCIKVVETLRAAGFLVLGVVAIFGYNLPKAITNFKHVNIPFYTTSNYDALIEVAIEQHTIKASDLTKLNLWKQDPSNPSWMDGK